MISAKFKFVKGVLFVKKCRNSLSSGDLVLTRTILLLPLYIYALEFKNFYQRNQALDNLHTG